MRDSDVNIDVVVAKHQEQFVHLSVTCSIAVESLEVDGVLVDFELKKVFLRRVMSIKAAVHQFLESEQDNVIAVEMAQIIDKQKTLPLFAELSSVVLSVFLRVKCEQSYYQRERGNYYSYPIPFHQMILIDLLRELVIGNMKRIKRVNEENRDCYKKHPRSEYIFVGEMFDFVYHAEVDYLVVGDRAGVVRFRTTSYRRGPQCGLHAAKVV